LGLVKVDIRLGCLCSASHEAEGGTAWVSAGGRQSTTAICSIFTTNITAISPDTGDSRNL
jgi:hypothetical protein